jgi:hypothetical protein
VHHLNPDSCWLVADIPRDLASDILEVVKASRISVSTKLRNVVPFFTCHSKKLAAGNPSQTQRIDNNHNE